jgi:hypothetical protein
MILLLSLKLQTSQGHADDLCRYEMQSSSLSLQGMAASKPQCCGCELRKWLNLKLALNIGSCRYSLHLVEEMDSTS